VSLIFWPHGPTPNRIVESTGARHGAAGGAPHGTSQSRTTEGGGGDRERERREGAREVNEGELARKLRAPCSSYKPSAPAFQAPIFSPGSRNSILLLGKSTSGSEIVYLRPSLACFRHTGFEQEHGFRHRRG
jgi:hypothetical protein